MARHLAFLYILLIVYASLHPFTGWRDSGAALFDFLTAPWPRYFTATDLGLNVLAYVPLGMLLVPALQPGLKPAFAAVVAVVAAGLVSFTMETLQHFLPSRVPSNVDLACNIAGAVIGSLLGLRFGGTFADGGGLTRWRERRIFHGGLGDTGLALMALWLLTQLNPEILLFGNGDLRALLGLPAPTAFTAERYFAIEQAVTASGAISAGLIFWQLMRSRSLWLLGTLFLLALLVRTLAAAILVEPNHSGQWLTPGNMLGFGFGMSALVLCLWLPAQVQAIIAALALLAGTALVNLAPENPYLAETLARWHQGHFLNFNGLTRLASTLWPFFALAFLLVFGPARANQARYG
jgi:VanZ family protein